MELRAAWDKFFDADGDGGAGGAGYDVLLTPAWCR
jgi:hypothetical protein